MLDQKQQSNSFEERVETIKQGGAPKYHEQKKAKGKLFVRDRLALYSIMVNMWKMHYLQIVNKQDYQLMVL